MPLVVNDEIIIFIIIVNTHTHTYIYRMHTYMLRKSGAYQINHLCA